MWDVLHGIPGVSVPDLTLVADPLTIPREFVMPADGTHRPGFLFHILTSSPRAAGPIPGGTRFGSPGSVPSGRRPAVMWLPL